MQATVSVHRLRAALAAALFTSVSILGSAAPAAAIEFWDGRLEVHGYYEQQIRSIWEDFSGSSDWDLTQWYHVLNLEIEADIAPDGFGPFDMVSAFARVEARFDCVWRRGCYMLPNVDVYGDRPGRLPARMASGHRSGFTGHHFTGDVRRQFDYDIALQASRYRNDVLPGSRRAVATSGSITYAGFFGASAGLDGVVDARQSAFHYGSDDPALQLFADLEECLYTSDRVRGSVNGTGNRELIHSIRCKVDPNPRDPRVPNPFREGDPNKVVLGGAGGGGALPFRPAPKTQFDSGAPNWEPSGIWYPSSRLQQMLKDGEFDATDQNFTVNELQWNRGASQQDEKELKEAYLEVEAFDSRLWIRAGKQNIVWGKTELFRTTDQFNPQDLALASLPNLEESRIALWAIRAIWSFYEVGPFEDVRFELAANFDQFEPGDIGRSGEPYTPKVAAGKAFGLLNHGQNGIGLAGEIRPPNPWNSWKGIEIGGRIEWRWDRFSFAISDFYGYSDFPYADVINTYSRNVDPVSGRPRKNRHTGKCRTGSESSCLTPESALLEHSVNQTAFAWVCAGTVGVSALDPASCAQSIFNSQVVPSTPGAYLSIASTFGQIASGQNSASATAPLAGVFNGNVFYTGLAGLDDFSYAEIAKHAPFAEMVDMGLAFPDINNGDPVSALLVSLNADTNDGPAATPADFPASVLDPATAAEPLPGAFQATLLSGLSAFLTDEQEALLGCGPFYQTNCDVEGLDFLNADANALFEAVPLGDEVFRGGRPWDTTDASKAQPGTVFFDGYTCANIAGCRGPGDKGYRPDVDGTTSAVHPFTGQAFRAEITSVSWNFMMALVGLSQGQDGANFTRRDSTDTAVFDPRRPFATGRCSYREPTWCSSLAGLALALTGVTRSTVKAGGNGKFGRRQFLWQGGNELVLRYEKRNVLGFSMDFAEDVLKSNWSFEFTWIEGVPTTDSDAFDGTSEVDNFNLTISVDRPTFINFLNANRTFFFNSQAFFQYREDLTQSHVATGPWNFFITFSVSTGYFQDRLLPSMTFVYDQKSNSGAWLPQVTYRFTENFSATFGLGVFSGRWKEADGPINDPAAGAANRIGKDSQKQFFEPGLSAVRERDEIFIRLRYTF